MDNNTNGKVTKLFFPLCYIYCCRYEILAGTFLGIVLSFVYIFVQSYSYTLTSPEELKKLMLEFGRGGIVVFTLLQLLQVVIFFIPGEFLQAAGGYIYGVLGGSITSIVGILLGSALVFVIARKLGKPFLEKIISEKNLRLFKGLLHTGYGGDRRKRGRVMLLVFFIYFIPGFPKDAIAYITGITDMKLKDFLLASMVARIPGIIISASFGAGIYNGNKHLIVFIAVSALILCAIGAFKGKNLLNDMKGKD
ncbi:TVP38/TMEM64 family protein [Clostridium thermarum]|uniref:TVP38/TMEM64 family protein n=1 Tax=Clostridium thermarum TaxID=1716543 RepID=UPI00111D24F2|nr:TVP38/TMEM64 family protein [Clostridium thermarum]